MQGKPCAGNPCVRFDEGPDAPKRSGCSALPYKESEGRSVTWRAAAAGLAVFYALVVLMNAPAMEKNAENMDYGVARDATKALVRPVAHLSAMFRLDFLRRGAARVRGRWLDQADNLQ